MNQVPHITIEQVAAMYPHVDKCDYRMLLESENSLINAYNEKQANEQPLITAEEARALGAGKAEYRYRSESTLWSDWKLCASDCCYINSRDYWEVQYRCTPKPTCQVKNIDTGELKTITREAAKLLQAELGDTVEWFNVLGIKADFYNYRFDCEGIYSYKLKPIVKLTIDDGEAKMYTPAQCNAETLARIDTHDIEVLTDSHKSWELADSEFLSAFEYRLIRKQPKLIPLDWKNVPVGVVVVQNGMVFTLVGRYKNQAIVTEGDGTPVLYKYFSELELAPASEQPWFVYIQGETDLSSLKGVEIELLVSSNYSFESLVNTEHATSYPTTLLKHQSIKAYRITGLADGYTYGGEV